MSSFAIKINISIDDLVSVLYQLSERDFEHVIQKMIDQSKKNFLIEGYKKLSKLKFEDIGDENAWLHVENEALDILEKELT